MQICFCIFLLKLKSYRSKCHVNNFRHASKTHLKYNVSGRFVKSPTQDLFVMKELPFKRESVNLLDSFRVHDEQLVIKSDASYKLWSPSSDLRLSRSCTIVMGYLSFMYNTLNYNWMLHFLGVNYFVSNYYL